MRITGFRVDGFGLLHDQVVQDVGPGTTVVLGPNEAGKSTLHAFLVRTLFGHPRANDADGRNRHQPLRGGRHGGVVHCEDATGRWEVHRHTEGSPRLRVVAPDGSEHTGADAVLPLLGQTVDAARYEQVFAIDLDDLAGVGSLGGGSLDDLLFDAATVGTGRSLRAARDEACERRDTLWTPTSTKRPLAVAIARRAAARSALASARDAAREHVDTRQRLDAAAARVEHLATEQTDEAARIALLERVTDAWPAWSRAERLRSELAELPDDTPPPDAVRRAEDAAEDLLAAEARATELAAELAEAERSAAGVEPDDEVLAVASEVEALAEGLGAHELAVEQLAAATSELVTAEDGVTAALAELGEGTSPDDLPEVPTDAPTRQRLVDLGDALLDAGLRAEAAAERAAEARATAQRLRARVSAASADLPDAPDEEELAAAERALGVLRVGVPALQPDAPAPRPGVSGGPGLGTTLVVAGVVVLAGGVAAVPGGAAQAVVAVLGAVLGAAGAYLLGRGRGEGRAAPERPGRARGVATDVAAAARVVALPDRPSLVEVEEVAGRVEAARRAARRRADAERHLATLREEAEEAGRVAVERTAVADARHDEESRAAAAWSALCTEVGLDPDEGVRVVRTRHERTRAAQRAVAVREAAAAQVRRLEPRVERFHAEVDAVVARLGHGESGQAAVRLLPGLRDRVRSARRELEEQRRATALVEELASRHAAAVGAADAARRRRDEALDEAGADDLDELRRWVRDAAHRAELVAGVDAAERAVTQLLGSGPRGEEGRALLRGADPTAWEQELAAAREAVSALTRERDAALAERTELEAELRDLGGDDAVPRAEQELAAAEVEVAELAERWAVADTAARLLEETVARFEREQQPRVLQRASELLGRATGGQWAQVRRLDGRVVVARSTGGDPVPAEVLSRGTREQLWLCLRLALAEDLAHDRPLPLLVDDLLGTSDPERSLHVARVLAEVATRQQVWLFTCHPRTADLVTSTDPTAGVLRLRRGGQVAGLVRQDATSGDETVLRLDV